MSDASALQFDDVHGETFGADAVMKTTSAAEFGGMERRFRRFECLIAGTEAA
jgi:hypothetical protein